MRFIAVWRFTPKYLLNGWIMKGFFDILRTNGAATRLQNLQLSRSEGCSLYGSWAARTELVEIDVLVLISELSVALIASAGIVVAIGGRGREYTANERTRIVGLIGFATLPLAVCLFGLVLISASVQPPRLWALTGGAQLLLILTAFIVGTRRAAEFVKDPDSSQTLTFTVLLAAPAVACVGLLIYNSIWLFAFWPIVAACSYYILVSVWIVFTLVLESD
jgi:hypothetical protein